MHTSVLSPSNPMVALLYDDMTQAPVGTIGEEVWILPPVSVVADPVAWGRATKYEAGDQTQQSGVRTGSGDQFEGIKIAESGSPHHSDGERAYTQGTSSQHTRSTHISATHD